MLVNVRMEFLKYGLMAVFAVLSFSCNKDDDDVKSTDYNLEDPRIRTVTFLENTDLVFVVNDVEGIIYNYDSLAYGTDVSAVKTQFYGFTSTPTIQYKKEGDSEWTSFTNGGKMDFTSPLKILATSEDGANTKEYQFDLRIHNFDVAAFTWEKFAQIDISDSVVSQKALKIDDNYFWFCRLSDGSNLSYSSADGKSWNKQAISNTESLEWTSLCLLDAVLYVQDAEGNIYVSDDFSTFEKKESLGSISYLLFNLDDSLWAIKDGSLVKMNGDSFKEVSTLPAGFSTENILPFTAPSGFTQVGYVYGTQNESGVVWSIDYRGNFNQLVTANTSIPYLVEPMLYIYSTTLGIVGGKSLDGTHSKKCYASYNSGVSWSNDWHKDLGDNLLGIEKSGVFVISDEGEILIVGGNKDGKASPTVWKGVLNKITEDELNYKD